MAPDDPKAAAETTAGEAPSYVTADEFDRRLNAAISSHMRRLEKAMGEQLAKLTPPPAAPRPSPAGSAPDGEEHPQVKTLRQQVAELTRLHQEAEANRRATELKVARDRTRATVRERLEAKGIKGPVAPAVIAHLEATGQLTYADDGRPSVVVRRLRSKGALAPEELTHEDLAAGVEDWAKTDEAAAFLPPPAPPPRPARPAFAPAAPGAPPRPMSLAAAVAETVAELESGARPPR